MSDGEEEMTQEGAVVLFVGRLVKRKGVDDLVNAFAVVKERVKDASLVLVGEGPERRPLTDLVAKLNLSEAITFKGVLEGESLHREYSSCYTCVLPSRREPDDPASEGLGLALIEASMHGKPLVGTLHGGIPEVIQEGVNGFLVPENDPVALAGAITRLLQDSELAGTMGTNALSIARAKFTWEATTRRLLDSYVGPGSSRVGASPPRRS